MNFVVKKKDLLGTVLFVPFLKTEIYKYMLPIVDIIFDCFMVAGFCYLMYLYQIQDIFYLSYLWYQPIF